MSQYQVCPASKAEYSAALKLVFQNLPPEVRVRTQKKLLSAAARDEISFDGLMVARQGGQLRGAAWVRVGMGRIASVWPPRACGEGSEEFVPPLLEAMDQYLERCQVRLAQALVDSTDTQGAARLEAGSYVSSTDLVYLACPVGRFSTERPQSRLDFESYVLDQHGRLEEIVSQTYAGTRDFPELNEVCEAEDALTGYMETGVFKTENWLFVREAGGDVGCLLLADHPQDMQFELVYMGLIPQARGRALGVEIARYALWRTKQADRRQLVLGVDAANVPAINMYAQLGFAEWDRRRVFLKSFGCNS